VDDELHEAQFDDIDNRRKIIHGTS